MSGPAEPGAVTRIYLRVAAIGFPLALTAAVFAAVRAPTPPAAAPMAPPRVAVTAPPMNGFVPPSTSKAFEHVYEKAVWGSNSAGEGYSGSGSTAAATVIYRAYLQAFLKQHDIKSVVDAGCGDWEFSRTIDWTGIDYKGYDIVADVIEKNKKRNKLPNVSFFVGNITEIDLPPADLVISKHVLQHIPNRDVSAFLKQLPKYKHALLVNGVGDVTLSSTNPDILPGEYRALDPTAAPFLLPGIKELTYWDEMHMHQVVHYERK